MGSSPRPWWDTGQTQRPVPPDGPEPVFKEQPVFKDSTGRRLAVTGREGRPGKSLAERVSINQRNKARRAGIRYGYSLDWQGVGAKENGQAFAKQMEQRNTFGGGFMPSWQNRIGPNGNLQIRAFANQPDRIAEGGGEWHDAPAGMQKRFQKYRASGATDFQKFSMQRGLQAQIAKEGLTQDPATGNWYHPEQGAFNPNGYYRTADGQVGATVGVVNPGAAGYPGGSGGGGTASGAGGVSGGGLATGPAVGGPSTGIEGLIENDLSTTLEGGESPAMMAVRNEAKLASAGQIGGAEDAINQDAIRRGIYRSGAPAASIASARRSAAADYTRTVTAAKAQARVDALGRAQTLLDSRRSWVLANARTAQERELAMAQINLGYARIAAEKDAISQSYQNQAGLINLQDQLANRPINFTSPTGEDITLEDPRILQYLQAFS